MMDCHCGKPVRLGGQRVRVNYKHGVAHYIAHMDGSPICDGPWDSLALKPYPKTEGEKEWSKLIARWDEYQRQQLNRS